MLNNNEFDTFATKCGRHSQPLRWVLYKTDFINDKIDCKKKLSQSEINRSLKFACDMCPVQK